MSSLVRPFSGFHPSSSFGSRVVGPARSMLAPELKNAGADDELSFRHVVGRSAAPTSDTAAAWLREAHDRGAIEPIHNTVVVHSAERAGRQAIGLLADVLLSAYGNSIRAHEKTLARTEAKMLDYMCSTRLLGNPVVLLHRDDAALAAQLRATTEHQPAAEFEARDGTMHRLWTVTGSEAFELCAHFSSEVYVADGHHRLAAAASLARAEDRPDAHLQAGLYAESEFVVWAYARGISDVAVDADELIETLRSRFDLIEVDDPLPRPPQRHTFGARIGGRSFLVTVPSDRIGDDVHDRLDANLLQQLILEPHLGITDPRADRRLDVVADSGDDVHDPDAYDAWFLPFPTSPAEVMQVADQGRTMPPKSTFFLPKLPGGILIRPLDDA